MDERFTGVRDMFDKHLESGADVGASFSVTIGDETVVDLWGGYADAERTRPWTADTIVNTYSVTKSVTSLTALLVADRGDLDVHAPVARYWPEFAAAGKADVTVAQLMSHSSGLSGWREPLATEDLFDWEKCTSLLAAQEPFWKPGTASGYHAVTFGYLVGEVVRRVTGRSLGTVFREEIAEPLAADFHIGLPAAEDHRVAELIIADDSPGDFFTASEIQRNAAVNPPFPVSVTRTRAYRAAEIPAGNGHGNAHAVAKIHAILANGGTFGGRRYLSEAGCRKALEVQVDGTDLVLGMPMRFGIGFAVSGQGGMLPHPNTLYWGGRGGAFAVADLDTRTAMAYTMNRMSMLGETDLRGFGLSMAAWESTGDL
ncbi:serine hydrolase domain-containing protein [Virgisporangium aliadipatigenens]|nr:serine hydrolase domain-containing protein [Virgisporangium aliadipatigenens]